MGSAPQTLKFFFTLYLDITYLEGRGERREITPRDRPGELEKSARERGKQREGRLLRKQEHLLGRVEKTQCKILGKQDIATRLSILTFHYHSVL